MKEKFVKLDTDADGHLMYQQVAPDFSKSLVPSQKKYLKQVRAVWLSFRLDPNTDISCIIPCRLLANICRYLSMWDRRMARSGGALSSLSNPSCNL